MAFFKKKFRFAIFSYNNSSAFSPNKLLQSYLKVIFKDDECFNIIINIANTCIKLEYQSLYFKKSTIVIISKLNKKLYNFSKSFRPIVFLNTINKLIEKVIGEKLQFNIVVNNFIHFSQLSSLKFKLTINVGVVFIYII